ncbi:MAG: crosslink repair DNA glycosylase YcaQ family protein [Opitutaceae bacterium]
MGVAAPLKISARVARVFLRRVHGLDDRFADVGSALRHHGYVQIDPINICGRMHDLILRNRVTGYAEGDLGRHLHGDGLAAVTTARRAFEHHLPDTHVLVAFPLEAWPHLLAAFRHRAKSAGAWSGRLTPRERELAPRILAEIAARGPISSDQIDDDRRGRRVWGTTTLAKATLQKLFFHGRVLIARRNGIRRLYDLPERVLPADVLALPELPVTDTARWLAVLKLRQRRLALLKRQELALVADLVQPVTLETSDGIKLHCLRDDVAILEACRAGSANLRAAPLPEALLLAPLDPLIYDRRVTRDVWNFDYTWEAYTPAHKRVRGHYALPVLSGTEIVGHVEPKADRVARKLVIASRRLRRGYSSAPALKALAGWLGLHMP